MMRRFVAFLSAIILSLPSLAAMEFAEGTLLRDAEIESILERYIDPLFLAAGLNPKDAKVYLIASRDVNAAATLGNTILINTGFLSAAKNPEEVMGVLAHETGHIIGGHVISGMAAGEKAGLASLIGMIAGVAAGVATGNADVAAAAAMGGSSVGAMSYLHHSRGQEAAADQAGARLLLKMKLTASGLVSFLDRLGQNEKGMDVQDVAYFLTHPLSEERVDLLQRNAESSPYKNNPMPEKDQQLFALMKAKINAYMDPPKRTLNMFSSSNKTELARYMRAIAHYRNGDLDKANELIEGLIQHNTTNPYYWELKAQIADNGGDLMGAKDALQKASSLLPKNNLMRMQYAQALVNVDQSALLKQAKNIILPIIEKEDDNDQAWYLLSLIYGKENNMGQMALALSEMYAIRGKPKESMAQAKRAMNFLAGDKAGRQRAQDLIDDAKRRIDKE